ncbi:MAG: DUF308 domain-containing protein [Bacteroidales bacterium]
MENFIKTLRHSVKHWYLYLIMGIVFLLTSFWVVSKPVESYTALSILFSIVFLISGVSYFIFSIMSINKSRNWGWNLVYGVILLVFGIYLVSSPSLSKDALALYVGFISMLFSISAISFAIEIKNFGSRQWGWLLALGILSVIFSFLLIINPLIAGLTVVLYTGLTFASLGVFYIAYSFRMRKLKKFLTKIPQSLNERYHSLLEEFKTHFDEMI